MTLQDLGNLGEFLGAIAVVVSLIYLAVQIRQNTRAMRASTNRAISQQRNELNFRFGLDPAATTLLLRGAEGHEALQLEERFRYTLLMRAILGTFEDAYVQFGAGMSDAEAWELAKTAVGTVTSTPGFAAWWAENRRLFRTTFRSEIDRLAGWQREETG